MPDCRTCCILLLTAVSSAALTPVCDGGEPVEGIRLFESRVRPILAQHCYRCHSAELDEPAGGLSLDTADGIRRGGHSGAGVVPGDPAGSLVLMALQYQGLEMPPDEKLPSEQIADVRRWIVMGAPDSRVTTKSPETSVQDSPASDPVSTLLLEQFVENHPAGFGLPLQFWPNGLAAALFKRPLPTDSAADTRS